MTQLSIVYCSVESWGIEEHYHEASGGKGVTLQLPVAGDPINLGFQAIGTTVTGSGESTAFKYLNKLM